MAGMRKLRGKYFARITRPNGQSEKLIGLKTDSKVTARFRKSIVEEVESEIKAGKNLVFDWQRKNPDVSYAKLTLDKAVKDFLKARKADGLRGSTLAIYRLGLSRFIESAKANMDVKKITLTTIDEFKEGFAYLKPATMNMNLRTIKTFLFWLKERNHIKVMPKIKQLKIENSLPVYLSNKEFDEICKRIDPHYRRAFWFYRETGLRLSEPFIGTIDGNFYKIDASHYKGRHDHVIYLTPELKAVILEMRSMVNEKVKRGIAVKENAIHLYTEVFYKACKGDKRYGWNQIKDRKFHSLRHTCAVRLYLETKDIYRTMKQLGHSSVVTTERYSRFQIERLQQDFPDLVAPTVENTPKKAKIAKLDTDCADTLQPVFA